MRSGYGTAELASAAEIAIGIDVSPRAVATARARFGGNGTRFVEANLETDDLRAGLGQTVDAVVSFETLEHLRRPEAALSQFAALLRPGGSLICAVPNAPTKAGLPPFCHAAMILRREDDLVRRGILKKRLGTGPDAHGPQAIRWFANVLAYPTVENVDASYSMVAWQHEGDPCRRISSRGCSSS